MFLYFLKVVKAFERVNKVKVPYQFEPRRAGDVASSYCAADLVAKELGWKTRYGLDEMCGYCSNSDVHRPTVITAIRNFSFILS